MRLSAGAQKILAQLCGAKGAYLFGARDTEAPFKLNSGSDSLSVPRQAVDELNGQKRKVNPLLQEMRRILQAAVEVYKRETQRVIRMFLDHEITFAECRSALDAALGSLLRTLRVEQRASLHDLILANEVIVEGERQRCGPIEEVHR